MMRCDNYLACNGGSSPRHLRLAGCRHDKRPESTLEKRLLECLGAHAKALGSVGTSGV